MRNDWRKRLGALGAAVLLLTTLGGALASAASADIATPNALATFAVKVVVNNGSGGTASKTDFQYSVDGGPATNWGPSGIVGLQLDDSVPHTAIGEPFAGFTDSTSNCTDVTLNDANPTLCVITYTFIEPSTTTTTTTTTTTIPESTTTNKPGQTTVSSSGTDPNKCSSVLNPMLQPDSTTTITVTIKTDAGPQPHFGDPILLSNSKLIISIPATLLQAGVNAGLLSNGAQIPSVVTLHIAGSNTQEKTHTFVLHQTATVVVNGKKAQPLQATLGLPDTHWTPDNGTSDVIFSESSMSIVSTINLGAIGKVIATFGCATTKGGEFAALGATGAPVTTSGGGSGGGTTSAAGGGSGSSVTQAAAAAELPRTGSNPWPLLVLGAILVDLGMLALAGAKRGRRLLHR